MKKSEFIEALQSKNVRDYSYAIMFFVVSTFFAFFVIRPVLTIAISIQREAQDLKGINDLYERNIRKVLELQANIEAIRPQKHLLDEAFPSQPHLDQVIADIQRAAVNTGVTLNAVAIRPVELKRAEASEKELQNMITAEIELEASYPQISSYLRALTQQRRIKGVKNMRMNVSRSAKEDVQLSLEIELEAYYLTQDMASKL